MKILRSVLLEECDEVIHGFACDPEGLDSVKMARGHGLGEILTVNQVHGNSVFFADESEKEAKNVQADSIVTRKKGTGVGVVTADCVPILMYFPDVGCVAAVHAGWRGTLARVAENCVAAVNSRYSGDGGKVLATIGPAIGKCCYEVGGDVASRFASSFGDGDWLREKGEGKFLLDLPNLNRALLRAAGVSEIEVMNVCTSCRGLPSYRRDGSTAGRMLCFIGTCS